MASPNSTASSTPVGDTRPTLCNIIPEIWFYNATTSTSIFRRFLMTSPTIMTFSQIYNTIHLSQYYRRNGILTTILICGATLNMIPSWFLSPRPSACVVPWWGLLEPRRQVLKDERRTLYLAKAIEVWAVRDGGMETVDYTLGWWPYIIRFSDGLDESLWIIFLAQILWDLAHDKGIYNTEWEAEVKTKEVIEICFE